MLIKNINRQFNLYNRIPYKRVYGSTNSITFTASKSDDFILHNTTRTNKPMFDNGTEIRMAIENTVKNVYHKKYTPPAVLSNIHYLSLTNLGLWQLITDTDQLNNGALTAKKTFPNEELIPIAESKQDDKIAYLNIATSEVVVKKKDIQSENFKNFEDWFSSAIESIFNTTILSEEQTGEFSLLEEVINKNSKHEFKCPNGYKQARALNLTRFQDGWTMPDILESDLINYASPTIIPFACSDSGNTFAAFVNKNNEDAENLNVIVGTIYPRDRNQYAVTKDDKLITVLENYNSFDDWFTNQINKITEAQTY